MILNAREFLQHFWYDQRRNHSWYGRPQLRNLPTWAIVYNYRYVNCCTLKKHSIIMRWLLLLNLGPPRDIFSQMISWLTIDIYVNCMANPCVLQARESIQYFNEFRKLIFPMSTVLGLNMACIRQRAVILWGRQGEKKKLVPLIADKVMSLHQAVGRDH